MARDTASRSSVSLPARLPVSLSEAERIAKVKFQGSHCCESFSARARGETRILLVAGDVPRGCALTPFLIAVAVNSHEMTEDRTLETIAGWIAPAATMIAA